MEEVSDKSEEQWVELVYVWLDAEHWPRSKVRYVQQKVWISWAQNLKDARWNFDGSSTGQATTAHSEVGLNVVKVYSISERHYLLCECENTDEWQDRRFTYRNLAQQHPEWECAEPWFGFEIEFFLEMGEELRQGRTALSGSWPRSTRPGSSYCDQLGNTTCWQILRALAARCHAVGIHMVGFNAEVAPSQCEYQILCRGWDAIDDAVMSRYFLMELAGLHGAELNFHPKPDPDQNGSGLHTNFSVSMMRVDHGWDWCHDYLIPAMAELHSEAMSSNMYGKSNELRLTGTHETSSREHFSWGIGSRDTSVRIPKEMIQHNRGYLEDRRPCSNANYYEVAQHLFSCWLRAVAAGMEAGGGEG